ncbi:MAG: hypothetical protein ACO2PM_09245, partial [Pyrobaculum sp.]
METELCLCMRSHLDRTLGRALRTRELVPPSPTPSHVLALGLSFGGGLAGRYLPGGGGGGRAGAGTAARGGG